jgi:hypothetical protein
MRALSPEHEWRLDRSGLYSRTWMPAGHVTVKQNSKAQSHGCICRLPLRTASTASRIASITSWGCSLWMSWPLFVLVVLSTRLGGSTSRYPAKPARFSVSCGPGSHSERELVGWIVRVMAKVDCPQPQIAILAVSDRIACTRHGHHDRAVLDGDPQLANEVVLLGPPYARREVS